MDGASADVAPVSTTLTSSGPTCSRAGKPPFTVTTTHQCTTSRPIWALVDLKSPFATGINIHDPTRKKNRRIGPVSSLIDCVDDVPGYEETEDAELVRLELGQSYTITYTFSVVNKAEGLRNSDVYNLVVGNAYFMTLRSRRWWWMYEDEMEKGLSSEGRRRGLAAKHATEWKVDCMVPFEFTE